MTIFLTCSFILWLLLNVAFFCTIKSSFLHTFFGFTTAPQCTCDRFLDSEDDQFKFAAAFDNRKAFTKSIHTEIKEWVAANIDSWREEKPDFFIIDLISDEFLPPKVVKEEGGASRRRRSSLSWHELIQKK